MANKYNTNLIKAKRSYAPAEIAKLFNIDKKTCFRWIDKEDLKVIQKNTKPLLIMGDELKEFLKAKQLKRKTKLAVDEYFCMKCQKATKVKIGSEKIKNTGKTIGKDNREQKIKTGICEKCGAKINRFLGVYQNN